MHFFDLLLRRSDVDLHKLWLSLTKSGALASDVTLAEVIAAFEEIQREFVRFGNCSRLCRWHGDTVKWRNALSKVRYVHLWRMSDTEVERAILNEVRDGTLVLRPEAEQIGKHVFHARGMRAAAAWAASPREVRDTRRTEIRSKAVTPSQLKEQYANSIRNYPMPNNPGHLSDAGQKFIFEHESWKNISNKLHHPGGNSGVTLGPGYDMKHRGREEIGEKMRSLGVDEDTAERISRASRLHGIAAKQFVAKNRGLVSLSETQERQLLQVTVPPYEDMVRQRIKIPLEQHEFDALVSFAYNPAGKWSAVEKNINAGRVDQALSVMRSAIGNVDSLKPGLQMRRNDEVNLFINNRYLKNSK